MPTKFRFFPSSFAPNHAASTSNGSGATVAPEAPPPEGEVHPLALTSEPSSTPEPAVAEESGPTTGLHDIIKNTDFGFNYNLSSLEKFAVMQAGAHAQAGLPRQQVVAEEEVAIESVLRGRAIELFLDWASRVRRRVQDAIQFSTNQAGDGIVILRHQLDALEATAGQMSELRRQLLLLSDEATGEEKTFEYMPLLGRVGFWSVLIILTAVDWVANLPVFTQLLPQEPGADQRWQDIVERTAHIHTYGAGFFNLLQHIAFAPDVSLFALGVVVFLMFMAHIAGQSVRQLIAFWPKSEGARVIGLQSHRRQAWFPAVASTLGIVLVIVFLFIARAKIEPAARGRFEEATREVQRLTDKQAQETAAQSADVADTASLLSDAKDRQHQLDVAHGYAISISQMDGPITLLNIVLALVAATASYLHDKRHVGDARFADPRVLLLEQKLETATSDADGKRQSLRATDSSIQTCLAQARYLGSALPLRDWHAKEERLNGIIPLFRAENARQRGIDVQNILAFREDEKLQLPDVRPDEPFLIPTELSVYEREFAELRHKIETVDTTVSRAKMGVAA